MANVTEFDLEFEEEIHIVDARNHYTKAETDDLFATKKENDGKLDKVTGKSTFDRVYAVSGLDGGQKMLMVDATNLSEGLLVIRTSGGNIVVPITPTEDSHATSKAYVDKTIKEQVAAIVASAPDDFNTLKEMSDWIAEHGDSAAAMNASIVALQESKADKAEVAETYVAIARYESDLSTLATKEELPKIVRLI